ncbi:MAG: hypothetical protein JWL97_2948 [Gemmatimonadales bacterium]|nr:hypothetical protein [Gemmatimonadales bacterium]
MDPILFPDRKKRKKLDSGGPGLFDLSDKPPETPFQVKSRTSIDAAHEIADDTKHQRRRHVEMTIIAAGSRGLARFEIAERLGVPHHWVTSSVDALIKMRRIEERDEFVTNPQSKKRCAVLVSIAQRASA